MYAICPLKWVVIGLAALHHTLHEQRPSRPQVGTVAVQLRLACLAGGAANGDILERTAKTAHHVALEVVSTSMES